MGYIATIEILWFISHTICALECILSGVIIIGEF